ncbi:DUF1330 domain-containing protein [Halioglobus maricola]|uniref:DUF1330 domain-containing protein n=1 Tax=Halioglobus maricola TaxID=2601894 RepID=A0A5P9NJ10_9GAMM|nr:DUF1330 domain-containing protein [Halioglobus maricola]QFU75853.1 DUF1330 domain-containing protein [Halioglobus maricola]
MAAYAIVDVHIFDIADYLDYQQALGPLLREAGARYLARGGEFEVFAGHMQPERLIILEFPSHDRLRQFFQGDDYQALLPQQEACCRACVIGVSGLPEPTLP